MAPDLLQKAGEALSSNTNNSSHNRGTILTFKAFIKQIILIVKSVHFNSVFSDVRIRLYKFVLLHQYLEAHVPIQVPDFRVDGTLGPIERHVTSVDTVGLRAPRPWATTVATNCWIMVDGNVSTGASQCIAKFNTHLADLSASARSLNSAVHTDTFSCRGPYIPSIHVAALGGACPVLGRFDMRSGVPFHI